MDERYRVDFGCDKSEDAIRTAMRKHKLAIRMRLLAPDVPVTYETSGQYRVLSPEECAGMVCTIDEEGTRAWFKLAPWHGTYYSLGSADPSATSG